MDKTTFLSTNIPDIDLFLANKNRQLAGLDFDQKHVKEVYFGILSRSIAEVMNVRWVA